LSSKHIVVVGGGIIGSCAAWHLLQAGVRVTVLDAIRLAGATSGAGAGFVSHWSAGMIPMGEEGYQLQQYGLDFYRRLAARGQDIGLRANGTLMMALTQEGRETFVLPVLESPHAPKDMQELKPQEIAVKTQGLVDTDKVHCAAYNPHGIQFDTTLGLKLLVREIVGMGGDYHEQTPVIDIWEHNNSVFIETRQGKIIEADGALLAAGAWNGDLTKRFGWHLPMLRVLATRVTTNGRGLSANLPTIQCRELRLWLRETFGAIMWGTGGHYHPLHRLNKNILDKKKFEPGQPHVQTLMQKMVDEDHRRLEEFFPPLRGAQVASWAQGVPCYTPDRNPYLGFIPTTNHIVLAGGDNETGVTHGPGLGRLASEILLGRQTMVETANFRLDRFAQEQFLNEADVENALPAWSGKGERAFLEHENV